MVGDVMIEKYLLSEEKKKEYRVKYSSSIEICASRQKKTLELSKNGETLKATEDNVVKELKQRLDDATDRYQSKDISAKEYVSVFRKTTDIEQWPSIIVEIDQKVSLKKAADLLDESGFFLSQNAYDIKIYEKYGLFHFLHVHVPPVQTLLFHIEGQPFAKHVFDAERQFKLPEPKPGFKADGLKHSPSLMETVFPEGFPIELKGSGGDVKICIIDSGVDSNHRDFENRIERIESFTGESKATDPCGHGTHVSGIALGSGEASGKQYPGISIHSTLLVAKVLDKNGSGTTQNILSGMRWAYEQGAGVVNLSLGGSGTISDGKSILARACDALVEKGIVVCVSAGNSGA